DHDTGGGLLGQDQIRPEGQHEDLDGLPEEAGDGGKEDAAATGAGLGGADLVLQGAPAGEEVLGHAEGLEDLGITERGFDVVGGAAALTLEVVEAAAADEVVEPGHGEHNDGGDGGAEAEGGVAAPDDGDADDDPGGVEESDEAVGGEDGAQGGDVADALGAHGVRSARGTGDDGVDDGRGEALVEDSAGDVLQAVPDAVEDEEDEQGDGGAGQQDEQGLAAIRGQDAIEDLEHEQGGSDEQQIHDKGEDEQGAQQRADAFE